MCRTALIRVVPPGSRSLFGGIGGFFMIVAENTRDLSHEMNWPHICCAKTYKYCTFALAYVKIHIGFSKRFL